MQRNCLDTGTEKMIVMLIILIIYCDFSSTKLKELQMMFHGVFKSLANLKGI